ncbi:MAG TPA: hypothetical protein VIE89_11195 [Candidatus Binatia bacterium]
MEKREGLADFSLLGGPLYRLGCRLGLVRDRTNTIALGLVLGAFPWIVLVALALVEGLGHVLFSIEAIGAHVRLLVAIPLLFVCEAFIDPRFTAFVHGIVRSQVVPATACPGLESEIARIARWKDAWLPEAFFLVAAVLLALTMRNENFFDYLSGLAGGSNPRAVGWTSQWYWMVCIPLFRFLFMRWLWRLTLWCFFLWRVSRLELRLVPTHPDRAGGLGFLELVHTEFTPLILAISAAQSASLAQDIASGRMTFDAVYPSVALHSDRGRRAVSRSAAHPLPQAVGVQGQGPERLQRVRGAIRERVRQEMAGRRPCPGRAPVGHSGHPVPGRPEQQRQHRARYAPCPRKPEHVDVPGRRRAAAAAATRAVQVSHRGPAREILREAVRPVSAANLHFARENRSGPGRWKAMPMKRAEVRWRPTNLSGHKQRKNKNEAG